MVVAVALGPSSAAVSIRWLPENPQRWRLDNANSPHSPLTAMEATPVYVGAMTGSVLDHVGCLFLGDDDDAEEYKQLYVDSVGQSAHGQAQTFV